MSVISENSKTKTMTILFSGTGLQHRLANGLKILG